MVDTIEEEFCLLKKEISPKICEMNPSLESRIPKITKVCLFCPACYFSDKTKLKEVIKFLKEAKRQLKKE